MGLKNPLIGAGGSINRASNQSQPHPRRRESALKEDKLCIQRISAIHLNLSEPFISRHVVQRHLIVLFQSSIYRKPVQLGQRAVLRMKESSDREEGDAAAEW